jgi:hypothetical protein
MNYISLDQVISEHIRSPDGALLWKFTIDTDHSGWFTVCDNDLEVEIRDKWEFDPLNKVIIMTINSKEPLEPWNRITIHLSEFRSKLMTYHSAYDVVGQ